MAIASRAARDAVLALDSALPFGLISAPGAGAALGGPWWRGLMAGLDLPHVLDCGANAALAAWAMRQGQAYVVFEGPPAQRVSLLVLAETCGSTLLLRRPDAFLLTDDPTPYRRRRLADYLAAPQPSTPN
ncbi:hypothetical protein [Acidomonas methanolica]|uniref:hypothetical protein n=1 Tax=Acidomonas methanolica TaxID=437 RepID=UPI00211A629C|nr:hypothetical protein [Acidomonas methanolica]MCQ9155999.1 hypothetical protein [Acidomonas methanolica]